MRVLFVLKQLGYLRHFESVVRELARRGHVVRLACQDGETTLPDALKGLAGVSAVAWPAKRSGEWMGHASLLRRAGDYLRYLEPPFIGASKLRARAFEKLVGTLSARRRIVTPGMSDVALDLTADERDRLRNLVATIERAIPSDPKIEAFLLDEVPDLVVITPLIDLGSGQTDIVKGAAALGLPSAMALFSWDNLTTKGIVHDVPDRVLVWNERQRHEAVTFHAVPDDRIRVTGAPRFDDFFALTPAASREAFLSGVGLDPSAPTVLYLGSSKFVAENERTFVDRWLSLLRRSAHPALARCNVIVKPHPDVNRLWEAADATRLTLGDEPRVSALVSRTLDDPRAAVVQGKFTAAQLLYECLAHADAVVALNTSAELEAGILGKPVLTLPAGEDVADGQENTLHYHYLLKEHGGHVERAATMDAHLASLAASLDARTPSGHTAFIRDFLRPIRDGRQPTAVFVDELEALLRDGSLSTRSAGVPGRAEPRTTSGVERADQAQKTRLDYDGCSVWLLVSSPMEAKYRVRSCAKEPWTVAWLERLAPGDVLFDIGANVGAFSLLATKRHANQLRVVAFEPGYATFARLCDNIVLNGCDASILPVSNPLWSSSAVTAFKYRSLDPGQSRHSMKSRALFKAKDNDRERATERYVQPMLAMALDDMMRSYSLPVPTHIKLDVDGAEMHVLQGARNLLQNPGLRSLLIEVDRVLVDEVSALLSTTGLKQAAVHDREHKAHGPLYFEFART